ncbi:MAG: 5-(carboxyamino)imidazole ribonucleotide mutase [Candidatus Micrarchaeota archaeon]|nr:5-(carboxyamino)imidazole ribonucleotide mutase [Candidatus Micrarchaeota archaeon]
MRKYDSRGARIVSKDSRGERTEVLIVVGSEADMAVAVKAGDVLRENGIKFETVVASAHRNPKKLDEVIANSDARVFIGIAGLSAALPGAIAARTDKPVIGVPVDVKLEGLDALLSIMQMPSGVPVATVGIDNAKNAALLAARILKA